MFTMLFTQSIYGKVPVHANGFGLYQLARRSNSTSDDDNSQNLNNIGRLDTSNVGVEPVVQQEEAQNVSPLASEAAAESSTKTTSTDSKVDSTLSSENVSGKEAPSIDKDVERVLESLDHFQIERLLERKLLTQSTVNENLGGRIKTDIKTSAGFIHPSSVKFINKFVTTCRNMCCSVGFNFGASRSYTPSVAEYATNIGNIILALSSRGFIDIRNSSKLVRNVLNSFRVNFRTFDDNYLSSTLIKLVKALKSGGTVPVILLDDSLLFIGIYGHGQNIYNKIVGDKNLQYFGDDYNFRTVVYAEDATSCVGFFTTSETNKDLKRQLETPTLPIDKIDLLGIINPLVDSEHYFSINSVNVAVCPKDGFKTSVSIQVPYSRSVNIVVGKDGATTIPSFTTTVPRRDISLNVRSTNFRSFIIVGNYYWDIIYNNDGLHALFVNTLVKHIKESNGLDDSEKLNLQFKFSVVRGCSPELLKTVQVPHTIAIRNNTKFSFTKLQELMFIIIINVAQFIGPVYDIFNPFFTKIPQLIICQIQDTLLGTASGEYTNLYDNKFGVTLKMTSHAIVDFILLSTYFGRGMPVMYNQFIFDGGSGTYRKSMERYNCNDSRLLMHFLTLRDASLHPNVGHGVVATDPSIENYPEFLDMIDFAQVRDDRQEQSIPTSTSSENDLGGKIDTSKVTESQSLKDEMMSEIKSTLSDLKGVIKSKGTIVPQR